MSRCFPFPPPGYEKKARPDDDDAYFLIKEKLKDKKHKKDKKDKEKKEKREKDKERSGEKNREKKDRKRKHKEKDKNKEKEEKKDSEEKKFVGFSNHQSGEKLGPIGIQVDQTQHGRLLLELEKRVENQNGAREIRSVDKSSVKELSVKFSGKELESSLGIVVEGNQNFHQKFKGNREENGMPNGQSLKVSAKHLENGFLGNILAKEQKIVEGALGEEEKVLEKQKERKDKNKCKSSDGTGDKHKDRDRERKSKSKDKKKKAEKVKEASTPVQTKLIENGNNAVDIQNDRGSYLFKGSNSNNGNLGKRKEPEMNGFLHGNGSPINKLPRLLSSSKVEQNGSKNDASNLGIQFAMEREAALTKHKLDAKASYSGSVSENGTNDNRQTANNHAPERQGPLNNHHYKASESLSSLQPSLGIGRKLERYQTSMKCASKEQGMVTNHKLNKKVLSSQPIIENGNILESSQASTLSSAERQGTVSKPELDEQELRINGSELRKTDACSIRPSSVADQLKETVETQMKPLHPDAKNLTEILSIPKVEWSDIDNQAWLFAREDHGQKKPKIDSTTFEESKQVWAEALQLESADVTALPYVIPY